VKTRKRIRKEDISIIEENWKFRETDWDLIVDLWEKVFLSLLDNGSFSILELNTVGEEDKEKWLRQRENIDLFMMFVISEITLDLNYDGEDERLKLFKLLYEKNPEIGSLQGKQVKSKLEDTKDEFSWNELFISPYRIYIEE